MNSEKVYVSDETNPSKLNLIETELKEFANETTLHGVKRLSYTNNFTKKIIWSILLVASVTYCIIEIGSSINSYLKYEVRMNYQIIHESPVEFPAISFCNLNAFDVSSNPETLNYINNVLIKNQISPTIELNSNELAIKKVTNIGNILKASVVSNKSLSQAEIRKLGYNLESMMISCSYNSIKCDVSNFSMFHSYQYGNCFTFNGITDLNGTKIEAKRTSKSGRRSSLVLELFIENSVENDYYTLQNGVYVIVHNRTQQPLIKYEGISVQTGVSTFIGISRTIHSRLDKPYSNCRKNVDQIIPNDSLIFIETLNITKYSQKLCYEICLQNLVIIPNCGCSDPSILNAKRHSKVCDSEESLECIQHQRDKFDTANIAELCDSNCPYECDTITYETSINTATYPSDYYIKILHQQKGFDEKFKNKTDSNLIRSSVLMLTVYYDDLKYTFIEENPVFTFDTMLGIVGGEFGFFIGASCLSFIEVIEIFTRIFIILIQKYKKLKILN